MLTIRTICAAVIVGALLTFSSVSCAYAADPPPIPSFGLPEAPVTDTTTTTTATTNDAVAASSTASTTSSGPANVVVIIGLVLLAAFSLKKYSQAKKYSL